MALELKFAGCPKAYVRIFGLEVDADLKKAVFRVKSYETKKHRDEGNLDFRQARSEFRVDAQKLFPHFREQAERELGTAYDIEGETKKAVDEINRQRKLTKVASLKTSEKQQVRRDVESKLRVVYQRKLAEDAMDDILKGLTHRMGNSLGIGYAFLRMLPEFEGAKDV